jgi:hypothetical protein
MVIAPTCTLATSGSVIIEVTSTRVFAWGFD